MLLFHPMLFYEKLVLAMKQRGITQQDLRQRSKLSEAAVSRYLSGERKPNVEALIKLSDALGVEYGEMVSWFKEGTPNLKQETLIQRIVGYVKSMSEFEQQVYADSLEKRSKGERKHEKGKPIKKSGKSVAVHE